MDNNLDDNNNNIKIDIELNDIHNDILFENVHNISDDNINNDFLESIKDNHFIQDEVLNHLSIFDNSFIQHNYLHSNSPLTMSENNSDDDEIRIIKNDRFKDQIENHIKNDLDSSLPTIRKMNLYKKKEYQDVVKSLTKYYEYDNKYSNKLDILITYMKGQKNIYIQANSVSIKKHYALMIPIMILSAFLSIFVPILQSYYWSGGFFSGMNIIITSLLTISNFMNYDLKAEKFHQLASQYDKLELSLEMTSGKLIFIEDETAKNDLVLNKLKEIEFKLNELKEAYNVFIPFIIKNMFPIICNINIFSLIKKMELHKRDLIHKFKDVKNEIRYILYKWKNNETSTIEQQKDKNRLLFLYDVKEKIKMELGQCKDIYDYIDKLFTKEIKNSQYLNHFCLFCWKHQTNNKIKKEDMHPIIIKYFDFIFEG